MKRLTNLDFKDLKSKFNFSYLQKINLFQLNRKNAGAILLVLLLLLGGVFLIFKKPVEEKNSIPLGQPGTYQKNENGLVKNQEEQSDDIVINNNPFKALVKAKDNEKGTDSSEPTLPKPVSNINSLPPGNNLPADLLPHNPAGQPKLPAEKESSLPVIKGIVKDSSGFTALVESEEKSYVVAKGDKIGNQWRVVSISQGKVVINDGINSKTLEIGKDGGKE